MCELGGGADRAAVCGVDGLVGRAHAQTSGKEGKKADQRMFVCLSFVM